MIGPHVSDTVLRVHLQTSTSCFWYGSCNVLLLFKLPLSSVFFSYFFRLSKCNFYFDCFEHFGLETEVIIQLSALISDNISRNIYLKFSIISKIVLVIFDHLWWQKYFQSVTSILLNPVNRLIYLSSWWIPAICRQRKREHRTPTGHNYSLVMSYWFAPTKGIQSNFLAYKTSIPSKFPPQSSVRYVTLQPKYWLSTILNVLRFFL